MLKVCPHCQGRGEFPTDVGSTHPCSFCDGTGRIGSIQPTRVRTSTGPITSGGISDDAEMIKLAALIGFFAFGGFFLYAESELEANDEAALAYGIVVGIGTFFLLGWPLRGLLRLCLIVSGFVAFIAIATLVLAALYWLFTVNT